MQTVSEQAQKLRNLFLSKHSGDIEAGNYHPKDVEKLEENDEFVAAFIRSFETLQDACNHLHESLKFRHDFEMNDAREDTFPVEIWESGAVYFHNHDKDGHAILYLQVKQHNKDPEMQPIIKKFFAFMLERYMEDHPGETIVVLFDLVGAGLAQLDMEFIKFIINCFKMYYPKLLEYMLMYEMPWLFNAAWKIIKQMLHPESVKRIKFVNKAGIQEYINKDQLWEHMGGTDKFVYKYEQPCYDSGGGGDDTDEATGDSAAKKRVTFSEEENRIYKSFSNDSIKEPENAAAVAKMNGNSNSIGILRDRRGLPSSHRRRVNREDNSFIGRLLTICPAEELEFVIEDGVKEACDTITLKNTLPYSIAYKVKTTSPEKYRVRPSSGLIKSGSETEIVIHLQQGYQNTVHKDKFLIMAMEVANESNKSLSELWKSVQKDSIMEHRLRCVASSGREASSSSVGSSSGQTSHDLSDISKKVESLVECNNRLHRTMKFLLITQVILVTLLLVLIIMTLYPGTGDQPIQAEEESTQHCFAAPDVK